MPRPWSGVTSSRRPASDGGIFALQDPLTGEQLKLVYDDIDFTRTIDGYGFFPT